MARLQKAAWATLYLLLVGCLVSSPGLFFLSTLLSPVVAVVSLTVAFFWNRKSYHSLSRILAAWAVGLAAGLWLMGFLDTAFHWGLWPTGPL